MLVKDESGRWESVWWYGYERTSQENEGKNQCGQRHRGVTDVDRRREVSARTIWVVSVLWCITHPTTEACRAHGGIEHR